jgi:hypothetical protein
MPVFRSATKEDVLFILLLIDNPDESLLTNFVDTPKLA